MRDWTMTDLKDREILKAVRDAEKRNGTWLPWRGSYDRARRLARNGLLRKAGTAAMPPHVLYVLSDLGIEELQVIANREA